jgi:hypothetical protein
LEEHCQFILEDLDAQFYQEKENYENQLIEQKEQLKEI